jgi:transcriptional regulator with XRE-family HTH domain
MARERKEGSQVEQWDKVFGAQVRLKRVERGLYSQQALAERMGFATHGTIAQIEMGNVVANFDVACQLAVFLGISLDAILGMPPQVSPAQEWYSDMFMVRLPGKVHELWTSRAQQQILTRTVQEMGRAMEETMGPPLQTAGLDTTSCRIYPNTRRSGSIAPVLRLTPSTRRSCPTLPNSQGAPYATHQACPHTCPTR